MSLTKRNIDDNTAYFYELTDDAKRRAIKVYEDITGHSLDGEDPNEVFDGILLDIKTLRPFNEI